MNNLILACLLAVPGLSHAASLEEAWSRDSGDFTGLTGLRLPPPIERLPFPDPHYRCRRPLVHIDHWGQLYKDGVSVGARARSFKTSCSGDVAWTDGDRVFKNEQELGRGVNRFAINEYTGQVLWVNRSDELYRDSEKLGDGASRFLSALFTGDVGWMDRRGDVYKNERKLGSRAQSVEINDYTGAVVWLDSRRDLYRDDVKIGDSVQRFKVARYSAAIAWVDSRGDLYKDAVRLDSSVMEFKIESDGRMLWRDRFGREHFQD